MTEAEWWEKDAERLNRLAKIAKHSGVTVGEAPVPPDLNPDGSLVDPNDYNNVSEDHWDNLSEDDL